MTAKNEFQGDIGQAVMGDVREAPRIHNNNVGNVVHVNVGAGEDDRPITELQRTRIAAKVKEVVEAGGVQQLDVYRVILTDLGVRKIAELPRSKFKDAMSILDDWLARINGDADQVAMHVEPSRCESCVLLHATTTGHGKSVQPESRLKPLPWVVALLSLGVAAWALLGKLPLLQAASNMHCHHEGKTFTVGSAVRMGNGAVRECVIRADGDGLEWAQPRKSTSTRRNN